MKHLLAACAMTTALISTSSASGLAEISYLRDHTNRIIGTLHVLPNGVQELRDKTNHIRGRYNPKTNETRNHTNHLVGRGNLLVTLLK